MRIVSQQRDYYDCGQRYGQDRSCQYIRTPIIVEKKPPFSFPHTRQGSPYIIGFCGKVYPMVFFRAIPEEEKPAIACFSMTEFETHLLKLRDNLGSFAKQDLANWFSLSGSEKFMDLFVSQRSPIFITSDLDHSNGTKIEFNVLLRPFLFYRVFDAYQAYQEIYAFLSNLAVPQKPMPIIPDQLKVETHGFDPKYAFRTRPTNYEPK